MHVTKDCGKLKALLRIIKLLMLYGHLCGSFNQHSFYIDMVSAAGGCHLFYVALADAEGQIL